MLTYELHEGKESLYKQLYKYIKNDIISGELAPGTKMPSRRSLAKNLGISTVTVNTTYDQLMDEGYIFAKPKVGYFICEISNMRTTPEKRVVSQEIRMPKQQSDLIYDFSSGKTAAEDFPFSVWAKLSREIMADKKEELLKVSPCGGVRELREAIAAHLSSFRGMVVDPDQIIVGAGTEYLYGLLIKLFGTDKMFCIENPGHKKIRQIYDDSKVRYFLADMDEQGIKTEDLQKGQAEIAHISPTHHFPTGVTMPVGRRYEILSWASEEDGRYIIEDDYDSEFRLRGKPIPSLQSIDDNEKVVYVNTFSKSLTSTIRISYMVLPPHLANRFYETMSFYSCTVSTFEQYTLAAFIAEGYFEKHINRMRLHYGRRREQVISAFEAVLDPKSYIVHESDSGLHFLLELKTQKTDKELEKQLLSKDIRLAAVTDYDIKNAGKSRHLFIVNYANIDTSKLREKLKILAAVIK